VAKNTVYKSDNGGSGSMMAVRPDAINSQSVDTVQASAASAAAAAVEAMGTDDATAEMDEG